MPRYQVTICPDCSATLGAGGAATIVTTDDGLTCTHATAVSYTELQHRDTAALVTIISIRPQSMTPEIRTFRLTQQDLDGLASQRPNLTPADWAHACLNIDLESVYADAEFGKPESD